MDSSSFQSLVANRQLSSQQIGERCERIHSLMLRESPFLDAPNFRKVHASDLKRLFDVYDQEFFGGLCRAALGPTRLDFRISRRMTSAGGKTTRFRPRGRREGQHFEIAVSSTLLFQTFHDVDRTITVNGVKCQDRLQAMQRIFEHELIHLIELLIWDCSRCSAGRFQSIALRFFRHTDYRHALVTPRERASAKFGIRPGTKVRFRFEGAHYTGIVNRITKRATVLVEDPRGQRYSNGKTYSKFYIPLELLEAAE